MSCHDMFAWCHFHYDELLTSKISFLEGLEIKNSASDPKTEKKAHFFCKSEVFTVALEIVIDDKKGFLFCYVAIVFFSVIFYSEKGKMNLNFPLHNFVFFQLLPLFFFLPLYSIFFSEGAFMVLKYFVFPS